MAFKISCTNVKCLESENMSEWYANEGDITIKVVGDYTVEVWCKSCGEKIYITD